MGDLFHSGGVVRVLSHLSCLIQSNPTLVHFPLVQFVWAGVNTVMEPGFRTTGTVPGSLVYSTSLK